MANAKYHIVNENGSMKTFCGKPLDGLNPTLKAYWDSNRLWDSDFEPIANYIKDKKVCLNCLKRAVSKKQFDNMMRFTKPVKASVKPKAKTPAVTPTKKVKAVKKAVNKPSKGKKVIKHLTLGDKPLCKTSAKNPVCLPVDKFKPSDEYKNVCKNCSRVLDKLLKQKGKAKEKTVLTVIRNSNKTSKGKVRDAKKNGLIKDVKRQTPINTYLDGDLRLKVIPNPFDNRNLWKLILKTPAGISDLTPWVEYKEVLAKQNAFVIKHPGKFKMQAVG